MPKALLKQSPQNAAHPPQRENTFNMRVTHRVTPDFRDCVSDIRRLWGDTLDRNLEVAQIITQFQGTVSKAKFDDYGLPFRLLMVPAAAEDRESRPDQR